MNEDDKNSSDQLCIWREDPDGVWETSCGEYFQINDGTPSENGMLFCYHCGRRLVAHGEDAEGVE